MSGRTPALSTFKRRQGFTQKDINRLEKHGILELQQSGFHGHSRKHHKNVVVLDAERVNQATPGDREYRDHVDRRRRAKQRLLTAPYVEPENLGDLRLPGSMEKDHHPAVQFRISPFARRCGEETAALFGLSLSQYSKALLYQALGLTSEAIDRRRKRH